jgi:hypothetical protein
MYKSTPAGDMHREGGGPDQDVIAFFDMRGRDGVFYESSTMTKMSSPRSVTANFSAHIERRRVLPDGGDPLVEPSLPPLSRAR